MEFLLCLALSTGLAGAVAFAGPRGEANSSIPVVSAAAKWRGLPLGFERNEGQTNPKVLFLSHAPDYTLFLTGNGAVLALGGAVGPRGAAVRHVTVRLEFAGANPRARITGEDMLPGKSNYFIGNDPQRWHTNIPTYAKVRYHSVYPGVDVVYYGRQRKLENDFVVAPGANPDQVRIRMAGAERVRLTQAGELVLATKAGEVELRHPVAYQGIGSKRRQVAVRYVWLGKDEVGLEAKSYRKSEPLIIDPVLVYSTYLGGSGGDTAYGVAVDSAGDAYVTGVTGSTNFPVKSAAFSSTGGNSDAFIAKLNPSGSALIYSTYIGGSGSDSAQAIAIDSAGDAYVTGTTSSSNFPVTSGAFQATYGNGNSNAFVVKLSSSGSSLSYATYLGGGASDFGQGIAVDGSGDAFVTGSTTSPNFPTTQNPLQIGNDGCTAQPDGTVTCTSDAFVTEVNPGGSALVYSTYLGGSDADSGQAIAVDPQGNCYVAGYTSSSDFPTANALQSSNAGGMDGFVSELKPRGAGLVFSTYWGGSGNDQIFGLALDPSGNIYVAGGTQSSNLFTSQNTYQTAYGGNGDGFVTKFGQSGSSLAYSTFIGGTQADQANAIAVDSSGNAVVVGSTQSSDLSAVDPLQSIPGVSGAGNCGGSSICSDAFIVKLDPSGRAVYATYLGGSQSDVAQAVALDSSGTPYVAGSTDSANFPAIVGAVQGAYAGSGNSGNGFVVKVGASDAPGVALTPQSINFGNQTVNAKNSNSQAVTLINEGSAPLENIQITATAPFAQTNSCGTTVTASGGTCTINITFNPQNPGPVTNQIAISDNAANSPQYITVTGNGVTGGGGTLTITPSTLNFATQPIGTTSAPQTVQIVNASNTSVTATAVNISGQFTESNTCGATPFVLNAGASCAATIYFAPTAGGAQTGSFSLTSNAAGSPAVSLNGNGGALFTLSAANRSNIVVVGTTQTTFTIAAAAGPNFSSSVSLSCSSSATCSFSPASITPGQTSELTVTKLGASGIPSGQSSAAPPPVNFIVTGKSGTQTVTLPLSIFFAGFSVAATPALGQVAAGQSTTYTVTASPSNGFNQVVLLSCSGLPANSTCTFSPAGLTLNGGIAASSTLTISTTSQIPTSSRLVPFLRVPRRPGGMGNGMAWMIWTGLLLLLAGLFTGLVKFHRKPARWASWISLALGITLLSMGATGCNNLYYQNNISPSPVGTPSGVFPVKIQGTLGTNSGVTRSTTVNLSVGPSTT